MERLVWLGPVLVLGACVAAAYAVCGTMPSFPSLSQPPPLLAGASAGFGHWDGCGGSADGVSPELDKRLREQFPPGSPETALVATLKNQGFDPPTPCEGTAPIRHAHFGQPKDRPIDANVFWRVDDAGDVLWIHGFVFFVSL